jgi:WD40 repeat protein
MFAFSPDGSKLWGSDDWHSSYSLRLPSRQAELVKLDQARGAAEIFFNAQGERVAAVREGESLKLRNLDTGKELASLGKKWGRFSPDGGYFASIEGDHTRVIDLATGAELIQALGPEGSGYDLVLQVAMAHQAKRLAIVSRDTIAIYDPSSRNRIADLRGHKAEVWGIAFDESANLLVSIAADGTAMLWRVDTGEILATIHTGHEQRAWVALSPSGTWLAVGERSGQVRLWNLVEVRRQLRDAKLDWSQEPIPTGRR